MKLIAIDSSGLVASVAITEDDNLIAEYNVQYKKTHSQTLLPMLDELKKMVELDLESVDAIAISKGPGSFTGLRIGSATAKGLSQALNIPIVEIGTLEGLACNLYGSNRLIVPMMDARRSQVYTAIFGYEYENGKYVLKRYLDECAIDVKELTDRVNEISKENDMGVIFLGDGLPVYENEIDTYVSANYIKAPSHMNRQRAAAFSYLAIEKFNNGEYVKCEDHAPDYLRLSQAERERNEGIRNKGSNY